LAGFATFSYLDPKEEPSAEFVDSMLDDLNTPRAIAELHRLQRLAQSEAFSLAGRMSKPGAMITDDSYAAASKLAAGLAFLGIDIGAHDKNWVERQANARLAASTKSKADDLVAARAAARKARNFVEADRIRDQLDGMGIQLKDAKDPKTGELVTTWEVKR
jgi:cysteinyl-tRNA synthetase